MDFIYFDLFNIPSNARQIVRIDNIYWNKRISLDTAGKCPAMTKGAIPTNIRNNGGQSYGGQICGGHFIRQLPHQLNIKLC